MPPRPYDTPESAPLGSMVIAVDISQSPAVAELTQRIAELSQQLTLAVAGIQSPWMNRKQAAAYCRMGLRTFDRLLANRKVRSAHDPACPQIRLFKREWLDQYLESVAPSLPVSASSARAKQIVERARAARQGV